MDNKSPTKKLSYKEISQIYIQEGNRNIYYLGIKTPLILDSFDSKNENVNFIYFYILLWAGSLFLLLSKFSDIYLSLAILTLLALIIDLLDQVLRELDSEKKLSIVFSKILGRLIFGKVMLFRNLPSWDLAVVITLIPFIPTLLITIYFTSDPKNILSVFAPYIVFLWNSMSRKSSLYKACFDSYNKFLEKSIDCNKNNEVENNGLSILRNSLVIDILDFDLWAHKSFSELFIFELINSFHFIGKEGASDFLPAKYRNFYEVNQEESKNFSIEKFRTYLNENSLLIHEVSYTLNLSFQLRNTIHRRELITFLGAKEECFNVADTRILSRKINP